MAKLTKQMLDDKEDLAVFEERKDEPSISYEECLKKLKDSGKI